MTSRKTKVRTFLISETSIAVIRAELLHMHQNMISTTDTEASYAKIVDTLNGMTGVN
jgi:hypothetical protein